MGGISIDTKRWGTVNKTVNVISLGCIYFKRNHKYSSLHILTKTSWEGQVKERLAPEN